MNRNQKILFTCLGIWTAYSVSSVVAYLVYSKRTQTPDLPRAVDIRDATRDYMLNMAAIRRTEAVMNARYANEPELRDLALDDLKAVWQRELDFQKIAIREE